VDFSAQNHSKHRVVLLETVFGKYRQEYESTDVDDCNLYKNKYTCLVGSLYKVIGVLNTICKVCVMLCCMMFEISQRSCRDRSRTHDRICMIHGLVSLLILNPLMSCCPTETDLNS
jgi:hypothetical protein